MEIEISNDVEISNQVEISNRPARETQPCGSRVEEQRGEMWLNVVLYIVGEYFT